MASSHAGSFVFILRVLAGEVVIKSRIIRTIWLPSMENTSFERVLAIRRRSPARVPGPEAMA